MNRFFKLAHRVSWRHRSATSGVGHCLENLRIRKAFVEIDILIEVFKFGFQITCITLTIFRLSKILYKLLFVFTLLT